MGVQQLSHVCKQFKLCLSSFMKTVYNKGNN
jgi:hypothetical protein